LRQVGADSGLSLREEGRNVLLQRRRWRCIAHAEVTRKVGATLSQGGTRGRPTRFNGPLNLTGQAATAHTSFELRSTARGPRSTP